jgi:hypothetical protein
MKQNSYFIVTIALNTILPSGVSKPATEQYLINALSFTEAEARVIDEVCRYIDGDYKIQGITKVKAAEIFIDPLYAMVATLHTSADRDEDAGDPMVTEYKFYKVKVAVVTVDEKTGAEKRAPMCMFCQARNFLLAVQRLKAELSDSITDYELLSVAETPILEYFDYKPLANDSDESNPQ